MDSLCDEILEEVNVAAPSQLHVIAIAIQSSGAEIHAIQL
jgi:hypothetical protein